MKQETLKAIELSEKSAARTRRIYMVMQIASILVFMALWHETPFAWGGKRLRLAQAVVWQLTCADNLSSQSHNAEKQSSSVSNQPSKEQIVCPPGKPFSELELEHARQLIAQNSVTPAFAQKRLELIAAAQLTTNVIAVPLLGFTIDINDLSLLGGITFLSLLLWFRFSLSRDEENIHYLLSDDLGEDSSVVHRLLSMAQVLMILPKTDSRTTRFWMALPSLLYWSPVVVQLLVLVNDLYTLPKGIRINPALAVVQFIIGLLLLLVLAATTFWCWQLATRVTKTWSELPSLEKAKGPSSNNL